MPYKRSEAIKIWENQLNKANGLCDECVEKRNKDIAWYVDKDLCKNHFLRSYKGRHGG